VHDIARGTRIGGAYAVEERISTGGMGAVYRGRRLADGTDVALKVLLEERNAARFEIEARLLSRLRHPRVVRVLDHVVDGDRRCLVMELVPGRSLAHVLDESGPLPVDTAVEHIRQACEALAYVHDQHVIHRDVKPANLILGEPGIVLVDFGIAREAEGTDHGTAAIGTPRFMAPEVLAGGMVSARSDVFGVAATLWTLVAGEPPGFLERASLGDRAQGVGRAVEAAVRAALEPDPYLRLPSVEAFARALGEGLGPTQGAPLGLSVERPTVPPRVLETIVRSAAGVFDSAAASIALLDHEGGELVYESSWGAGAEEIIGVRLAPGTGIAGAVLAAAEPEAIASCADDPRFARQVAARTGYVPNTMLVLPLVGRETPFGVLQVLDRRDGEAFGPADLARGGAFVELAMAMLDAYGGQTLAGH
jgi:predicted Ser/Thr protein kinase